MLVDIPLNDEFQNKPWKELLKVKWERKKLAGGVFIDHKLQNTSVKRVAQTQAEIEKNTSRGFRLFGCSGLQNKQTESIGQDECRKHTLATEKYGQT